MIPIPQNSGGEENKVENIRINMKTETGIMHDDNYLLQNQNKN
jgi:hypothetical protein